MAGVLARVPRLVVALVLLAVVLVVPMGGSPARAVGGYEFVPSGLDGAGFQNVVAYSPFTDDQGRRPVLLGADVAGVHRSVDGGRTWMPARAGLTNPRVASLLFSATVPGKVWAATDSQLYVSTDFGLTWTARAGAVDFDANGVYRPGGREHPRATGALIAEDPSPTSPTSTSPPPRRGSSGPATTAPRGSGSPSRAATCARSPSTRPTPTSSTRRPTTAGSWSAGTPAPT